MQFRTKVTHDHTFLLPPRVDEWIPAGHMARIVNEAVDWMDLTTLESAFHKTGEGAHGLPGNLSDHVLTELPPRGVPRTTLIGRLLYRGNMPYHCERQ